MTHDVYAILSTSGYSFHLMETGTTFSCSSKKQSTRAIPESEADYQNFVAVVQGAIYL